MSLPNKPSKSTVKRNPHLWLKCPDPAEGLVECIKGSIPIPVNKKKKKRLRQDTKPLLNQLESEYKNFLCTQSGIRFEAQAIRFRLGNGIWYKPDFIVISPMGDMLGIEVKGPRAFRGGFENLKVVASLYRWMTFKMVWKGEDGQWETQTILP